jgi:hypothetical protein
MSKTENQEQNVKENTNQQNFDISFKDEEQLENMSYEDLKEYQNYLNEKATEIQKENQSTEFSVELNEIHDIKRIMSHLDKGYKWKTNNAALVVKLYDSLKEQYGYYKHTSNSNFDKITISLPGYELNALYQALINVEGYGIEKARNFLRLLTNIGQSVSDAMTVLGDMNSDIQTIHQHLQMVDEKLQDFTTSENDETQGEAQNENDS